MGDDLDALMARVNASAFIDYSLISVPKRAPRPRKEHRAVKLARSMSDDQLAQLIALLSGKALLANLGGESYTLVREGEGYRVQATGAGSPSHFVTKGTCSCEDHRFRGRSCKHMELVRRFL